VMLSGPELLLAFARPLLPPLHVERPGRPQQLPHRVGALGDVSQNVLGVRAGQRRPPLDVEVAYIARQCESTLCRQLTTSSISAQLDTRP
jgi:hypothetical protein